MPALQALFAEINANTTEPIDVEESDADVPMEDDGEESTLNPSYIYIHTIYNECAHVKYIVFKCLLHKYIYIYYIYKDMFYFRRKIWALETVLLREWAWFGLEEFLRAWFSWKFGFAQMYSWHGNLLGKLFGLFYITQCPNSRDPNQRLARPLIQARSELTCRAI